MTALRIEIQFVCPKCGGHMFSSYNCTTPGEMTRYCTSLRAGADHMRCKTEFHERDDWKYFVVAAPAGIRRFKTRDEYELVMSIMFGQLGPAIGIGRPA